MEYSSNWDDEDFVLKFSDDECSDGMDHTNNYANIVNCCEFKDMKLNEAVKRKNGIFVDEGRQQKFSSQYLTSPGGSLEKQQEISQQSEKNNISDKIVNFSKLVNQLLNAKVVIKRMSLNFETSEGSAKKDTSSNGSRLRVSVQRYCLECQTVTVDFRGWTVKKSCPTCKSILKYMCSKCNNKHCYTYKSLNVHTKTCGLTDSTLKELHPSNFLVKKNEIDFSKEIIRYCSRCYEVDGRCEKWTKKKCRNCERQLIYQCSKCKAQYKAISALLYHMQSKCYPSQYKCNQCDFMSPVWVNIRKHIINIHLQVHSIIEPPTQLPNAKAVLRILEETPVEDTVSRNVGNHTNVNLLDEKELAGETNCNENVQLYCPTCKKTNFYRIENTLAKTCSDCKTAMTFLCTKCNVKHSKHYRYLLFHMDRCGDVENMLEDDIDLTESKIKDKAETRFIFDRSQFIVKKFHSVNPAEKWSRYCLKCGLVSASHNDRRCTCIEKLLYMCKKCNVKCSSQQNMAYHSENHCFPTHQYKCTQCEYSKTSWKKMIMHFKFTHTDVPMIKCEFCSYETRIRSNLNVHRRKVHSEINKFHCNSCSYSSKYKCNLQRHEKRNH